MTVEDLDKELLEQLHAATLKASDLCYEMKKICATVLVPTGTLVAIFSDKKLTAAVFFAGMLVIITFWLADSVGFYYQRRLRASMTGIWERRAARCTEPFDYPRTAKVNPLQAATDGSMLYYLLLFAPIFLAWLSFALGVIEPARSG